MKIRKLLLDYQEYTNSLISNWEREVSSANLLDIEYFHKLRDIYIKNHAVSVPYEGKHIYMDNPKVIDYLRCRFDEHNQNIKWLEKFLPESLKLSHTEPVCIDDDLHQWYINKGFTNFVHFDYASLVKAIDENLWVYQNVVYGIRGNYSDDEQKLLILDYADKQNKKIERLKHKFSQKESSENNYERTRIPEEVRIAVWRRDQGKCARCGNRENLEYDHIVPVSKGGGNTARNIELLCQDCNRSKGNRIE